MPFTGKVGDTLCLDDSGEGHRYIILTKPNEKHNVVLINFTSATYWKEWMVTFKPKDDKLLFKKKTTVNYANAQIIPVKKLIDKARRKPNDYLFCSVYHTKKIIIGAFQSQFIPTEILDELSKQYPDESKRYLNI